MLVARRLPRRGRLRRHRRQQQVDGLKHLRQVVWCCSAYGLGVEVGMGRVMRPRSMSSRALGP